MTAIFPGDIKTFTAVIDNFDVVEAANINPVYDEITSIETWLERALPIGYNSRTATMTTDTALTDTDAPIQYLDPTSDEFSLSLPSTTDTNHIYFIHNTHATADLAVLSGTDTIATIAGGETSAIISDGATWIALSGGGSSITYATTISDVSDTTSSAGSSDTVARGDHTHMLNIGTGLAWSGTTLTAPGSTDAGAGMINYACQGRLTLESGVPVSTTDQANKTTLYWTPYQGNLISLYTDGAWEDKTFAELSLNMSAYTASKPYDIWIYDNAGTVTMDSTVWTNATTRATALALQDGVLVKNGDATRRYVGTVYIDSGQKCQDTAVLLYVWNYYNRVIRKLYKSTVSFHLYSPGDTMTIRAWDNTTTNNISFVIGVQEEPVMAWMAADSYNTGTGGAGLVGFCLDAYNALTNSLGFAANNSTSQIYGGAGGLLYSGIGLHTLYVVERALGTSPNGVNFTAFYANVGVMG